MSQTTTTGDRVTGETQREPISSICDAWFLKNGDLQLLVKCSDGAVRSAVLELKMGTK